VNDRQKEYLFYPDRFCRMRRLAADSVYPVGARIHTLPVGPVDVWVGYKANYISDRSHPAPVFEPI
jgi:hypothetical protein